MSKDIFGQKTSCKIHVGWRRALWCVASAVVLGLFGVDVSHAEKPVVRKPPAKRGKAVAEAVAKLADAFSAKGHKIYRAEGEMGAVATDHVLASRAGLAVLKAGGNAVDAACAAAFAVGVVNPAGSGIGGGGFMMYLPEGKGKKAKVLDFRETAPRSAHAKMYLQQGLPRFASREGGLAVGVPGEVAGCATAVRRWGKLSLEQVLMPAIHLARQGFPVGSHLARTLKSQRQHLRRWPGLNLIFAAGGEPLAKGDVLRRPALARALQDIAKFGPKVFYRGWIARDIVATVRRNGGILTMQDLASYQAKERAPLQVQWKGYDVFLMPPPSSGGITMLQTLQILDHFPMKQLARRPSSYLHLLTEALKHAFADRARFLGDTDFVKVPLAYLQDPAYAKRLAARIKKDNVLPLDQYGTKKIPPHASHRGGGTSHISVIDADGNAVALTTTINTSFGSRVVAEKSGIILNNQMDDFAANPGKPNAFGLMQGFSNAVAPLKRPLSSMSPTIVSRDGKAVLSVGASGGPTIITGTLQVLLDILLLGKDPAWSVAAPRLHHQWFPPLLFMESAFSQDVIGALRSLHHRIKVWPQGFTAVQAVFVNGTGNRVAVSDPRKHGTPAAY
ncbi:MAG: gamma-glutamyltransferase [Myxococcales bacterium]|nr:gamma-glutamyltransferase [Myxococcales bacterium]